jgi:hypothetical protein
MKHYRIYNLLALLVILTSYNSYSQTEKTFVNERWNMTNGILGQSDQISTALDPDGNLVYVTNHLQNGNSDIFLNCIHPNGNVVWQQTCPSSPTYDDYGVDIKIDTLGNIYLCAAQHNGNNLDIWISKYTQAGTLVWEQTFIGDGNGDDFPSSLHLDDSFNVLVSGTVNNNATDNDIAMFKLNGINGSILWSVQSNITEDQEALKAVVDNNQDVVISGTSFENYISGETTVIKYDGLNGSQLASLNLSTSTLGIDIPNSIKSRSNNDIILVGTSLQNTQDSDIKIVSLNSALQLNWERYIDRSNGNDEGKDIVINSNGAIILTGFTTNLSGGREIFVSKISPFDGSEIWNFEKAALIDNENSIGTGIKIDANDDLFITGNEYREGSEQLLTLSLNDNGGVKWVRYFSNTTSSEDVSAEIQIDLANNIYVTGKTILNNEALTSTVKYNTVDRVRTIGTDSLGNPTHIKNQIIVQFLPSHVNTQPFDDVKLETGVVSQFISSTMLTSLNNNTGLDWTKYNAFKIHQGATSADTMSITRLGDTIRTSDYWASITIEIPTGLDEALVVNQIENLHGIKYVSRNILFKQNSVPNDSIYFYGQQQLALHPNNVYPDADVNVEGAWDNEVGQDNIKVGVFDNTIDWTHQEFGGQFQNFNQSKARYGYNYWAGMDNQILLNNFGTHGTKVAGIIGAHRNEGIGIAGIAGGDLGAFNSGVQLWSMGISAGDNFASMEDIKEAIIQGAVETTSTTTLGYGFGLHIQNHSWGTDQNSPHLAAAVEECWRNHCVFIAALGNENVTTIGWPSGYVDKKLISVIASGTDGERKNGTINGDGTWGSNYGWDGSLNFPLVAPDFMAPGVAALVSTTTAFFDVQGSPASCLLTSPKYRCFRGTSASAPIVSGVSALMCSKHTLANGYDNALSTEDVEAILEHTANDKNTTGYDYESGHGLINADSALIMVSNPYYVVHKKHDYSDVQQHWLSSENQVTEIQGVDAQGNGIIYHYDHVNAWRFTWIFNDSIPVGHEIIDSWQVEAAWKVGDKLSGNFNISPFSNITDQAEVNLNVAIGGRFVSGSVYTDLYEVTDNGVTFWYPFHPNELEYMYSLHCTSAPVLGIDEQDNSIQLSLFPNPTNNSINISFELMYSNDVQVQVVDAMGRIVKYVDVPNLLTGINSVELDVSSLHQGVYYCTLFTDNGSKTIPFVKSN